MPSVNDRDLRIISSLSPETALRPRTLEEALAYDNFALLRAETISIGKAIPKDLGNAYQTIYDRIRSDTFKKTDFAMSLLDGEIDWKTPAYIRPRRTEAAARPLLNIWGRTAT